MTSALGVVARLCRLVMDAASVSVARLEGDDLVFAAADGRGADRIRGVVLPAGRGIAGYVAASGEAIEVAHVADDPRFARDVAEATGYVPAAILAVPVVADDGDVVGVVSVLDRRRDPSRDGRAFELVGDVASVVAALLSRPPDPGTSVRAVVAGRAASRSEDGRWLGEELASLLDRWLGPDGPDA